MAADLKLLIDLQALDTRVAALESEAVRLPREIDALHAALTEAQKTVEAARGQLENARKVQRTKEHDLDDVNTKRAKSEARLWEVKTNEEYAAVLREIEEIKRQKTTVEEEILALMEAQERLVGEVREAEGRHRVREERARQDEVVIREKLERVEVELAGVREQRAALARGVAVPLLADYERILKARGGLAVAAVNSTSVCGGCRMSVRPQAILEIRSGIDLLRCESCGRFLYWQDSE